MNILSKRKKWLVPMLYLLPALLIYSLFLLYPLAHSLVLSFFEWNGLSDKVFVGLNNYIQLFTDDPVFRISLLNNIKWTIVAELIPVTLGLALALLMGSKKKGMGIFRNAIFFPSTLSLVIVSLMWNWMYNPSFGLINNVIEALFPGCPTFDWLSNTDNVIYFLAIAGSWSYTGICMVMFISGLQAIPAETYEAASIDGANKWQNFIHITIPQLRGTISIVVVYTLINSFKVYDIVAIMTNGGPGHCTEVLATWAYTQMFSFHEIGTGCAIAWILTLIVLILSFVSQKINGKKD